MGRTFEGEEVGGCTDILQLLAQFRYIKEFYMDGPMEYL